MRDKLKIAFRYLHSIWAIIGLITTIIFATATKGHPPGIVFIPIVFGVWVIGHTLFWFCYKLAVKGRQLAETRNNEREQWPLIILLLTLVFGGIFIFGLLLIITKTVTEHNWAKELPILLTIWLPPSICFIGILLRQSWSRIMSSAVLIISALLLLNQMIESLIRGNRASVIEWVIALAILITLLFLGQHILRSASIKAFYSNDHY